MDTDTLPETLPSTNVLPLQLASLVDLADDRDSTRFALSGVYLTVADGKFVASATNSKYLLRVSGSCAVADYPVHPELEAIPDGGNQTLISADVWRRAFATAKKMSRRLKESLRGVAVRIGADRSVGMGSTDGAAYPVEACNGVDGRYPPVDDILRFKAPEFSISVDARLLARLAATIGNVMALDKGDAPRVTLHFTSPDKPILFTGSGSGMELEGALMPFYRPQPDVASAVLVSVGRVPATEAFKVSLTLPVPFVAVPSIETASGREGGRFVEHLHRGEQELRLWSGRQQLELDGQLHACSIRNDPFRNNRRKMMSVSIDSLGDALPREIARVRDEILPEYVAIGPSGAFAVMMMRQDLDRASKAMIDGDTVAMIQVYESLKEYHL